MFDRINQPIFLDSSDSWWSETLHQLNLKWTQVSIWQKIAGVFLVFGSGLNIFGWLNLNQNLSKFSQVWPAIPPVLNPTSQFSLASDSTKISSSGATRITVHLAGSVKKPGIYNLAGDSLLADAVRAAGGLNSAVWQDYLDQSINLAEPLTANQKIWIPSLSQRDLFASSQQKDSSVLEQSESTTATDITYNSVGISINSASLAELMDLVGIGQKRAEDIVANRPYASIEELMTKAKLSESVFLAIKSQLKL